MPGLVFEQLAFKKDAYITTEGQEELDRFFIVKTGRVARMASNFTTGQNVTGKSESLGPGDFFGVISCMARRPRMETVVATEDTTLILIRREHFGSLIQDNSAIALKIIRYFSRQLRYFDMILTVMISKSAVDKQPLDLYGHLFMQGEYFLTKMRNQAAAGYAYTRYLQYRPDGAYVDMARKRLAEIDPKTVPMGPVSSDKSSIYKDGQIIFLEGETGNNLYVIQEGQVRIAKVYQDREVLLDVLKPGDIFGEMAILENKPRSANAVASGTLRLMPISRENFDSVVRTHPDIATRIIEILSDRIWMIYRQLANMFISDREIKLYDALYTQLLKNRVAIQPRTPYTFDFTTDDLLKFTGIGGQEGKIVIYNLLQTDKNLTVNPGGRFTAADISDIERRINVIKRNKEIQQNLARSEYTRLLENAPKI